MSSSEVNQALLQPENNDFELQNDEQMIRFDLGQIINNVKNLKSLEILQKSLKILTSNIKLLFFMILSIIPLFVVMVYFDMKLQKTLADAAIFEINHYPRLIIVKTSNYNHSVVSVANGSQHTGYEIAEIDDYSDEIRKKIEFLFDILQICVLFLVIYPLLELLSMTVTFNIASKAHIDEKPASVKQLLSQKNNIKGVLVTCFTVQLLSSLSLICLLWIYSNHLLFTSKLYHFTTLEYYMKILSIGVHGMMFLALLYKYMDWSALWNTSIAISVLEEGVTGLEALGMADRYGKHGKRTGFQLMLCFVAIWSVLRLPCFYIGGLCNGVVVVSVVIGFVCLGNIMKWVAFMLYFYDCKQQTMEKKNDEEVGKKINNAV